MIKKVTARPAEKPLIEKIISYGPLLPCIAVATLVLTGLSGYQAPATAVGGAGAPAVSASADAANAVSGTTVPRGTITRTNPVRTTVAAAGGAKKSLGTVKEASAYKDGTYTGTATGFVGPITVKVTVAGGKVTAITVTSTSDNEPYLSNAKAVIDRIITSQTTNVDVVSGATYSSNGIIGAVRNALSKAAVSDSARQAVNAVATTTRTTTTTTRKPVTTGKAGQFPYPDGTYEGEGEGRNDIIRLAVTLKDGSITGIHVLEHYEDEVPYFNNAKALLDDVLKAQTLDVDTVSGATLSSNGLLEALRDAMSKAEAASRGIPATTTTTTTTTTATTTEPDSETSSVTDATSSAQPAADQPKQRYADGDYFVSVTCSPNEDEDFEPYTLTVKVTISGDRITAVSDVTGDGDSSNDSYIRKAVNGTSKKEGVVSQITSHGAPYDVDAISGATCTSEAILAACEQALEQAAEAQR